MPRVLCEMQNKEDGTVRTTVRRSRNLWWQAEDLCRLPTKFFRPLMDSVNVSPLCVWLRPLSHGACDPQESFDPVAWLEVPSPCPNSSYPAITNSRTGNNAFSIDKAPNRTDFARERKTLRRDPPPVHRIRVHLGLIFIDLKSSSRKHDPPGSPHCPRHHTRTSSTRNSLPSTAHLCCSGPLRRRYSKASSP